MVRAIFTHHCCRSLIPTHSLKQDLRKHFDRAEMGNLACLAEGSQNYVLDVCQHHVSLNLHLYFFFRSQAPSVDPHQLVQVDFLFEVLWFLPPSLSLAEVSRD